MATLAVCLQANGLSRTTSNDLAGYGWRVGHLSVARLRAGAYSFTVWKRSYLLVFAVLLPMLGLLRWHGMAQRPPLEEADILIKDGHVIDGTGGPWMRADVA